MATNPFGPGIRPWARKTVAKIATNFGVLPSGEIIVDEQGGIYGTDGVTQTKNLSRLARLNETVNSTVGNLVYGKQQAATRHDPSTKADLAGVLPAGYQLDSGYLKNNTGSNPARQRNGAWEHNQGTINVANASYPQAELPVGQRVRYVSCEVAWAANSLANFTFVVPSDWWDHENSRLQIAGIHSTHSGNGVYACGVFNPARNQPGHVDDHIDFGDASSVSVQITQDTTVLGTAVLTSFTPAAVQAALIAVASGTLTGKVTVIQNNNASVSINWDDSLGTETPGGGGGVASKIHLAITAQVYSSIAPTLVRYKSGAVTSYADYTTNGRSATTWDGKFRPMKLWVRPELNKMMIIYPDGTDSGWITHIGIGAYTSRWAIYEQYENNTGALDTPVRIRKIALSGDIHDQDAPALDYPDVVDVLIKKRRQVYEFFGAQTGSIPVPAPGTFVGISYCLIHPGAGGGSGRRGAAATVRNGGGAGAPGPLLSGSLPASAFTGASSLGYSIPAPGTGGAAVTTDNTDGNAGTSPASTTGINWTPTGAALPCGPRVGGTTGGGAGTNATGAGGGAGFPNGTAAQGASTTGGAGNPTSANSFVLTGQGGSPGAGGGITAADVASDGGYGQPNYVMGVNVGGVKGTVDTTPPTSGYQAVPGTAGHGPGGGAASKTQAAQAGADGIGYGSSGGGGGASLNGFNSGKGGNGGPGYIRIEVLYI